MENQISITDKLSMLNSRIDLLASKGPILGLTDLDSRIAAITKERDRVQALDESL